MGGAQALNYLTGLIRVKIVAVLLGPTGVGLVSLYTSTISLIGTITNFGISASGVREVAQANGQQQPQEIARTIKTLRLACWATGLFGWLITWALAKPLGTWIFGSPDHTVALQILGVTLLFSAVGAGQTALLQGLRRIGDLARINIASMLINTGITVLLYAWLGVDGIVPVLTATALASSLISWAFARRIEIAPIALDRQNALSGICRLANMGIAFMWSGVLTATLDIATKAVITKTLGIDAAGLYQAAWALSGLFAGFILSAMGMDFYPRLTGAIGDPEAAICIVNEQTEIGMLLALPGLLLTLAFAPQLMSVFYSKQFLAASELLPWFLLGIFLKVVSWPLGYIQLAKGASRWFMATEACFFTVQVTLTVSLLPQFGIIGAAYSFAASYLLHISAMHWVAGKLLHFRWSAVVKKLLWTSGSLFCVALLAIITLPGWQGAAIAGSIGLFVSLASMQELIIRLKISHRVGQLIMTLPKFNRLFCIDRAGS